MKRLSLLLVALLFVANGFCQSRVAPELNVRTILTKDSFAIGKFVSAKVQLTNATKATMCFPEPAQNTQTANIGWIITTGLPIGGSDHEVFLEVIDGGGKYGKALESDIKNSWIKLKPGESYTADVVKVPILLDEVGTWRILSSYHPPEGSFSAQYRKLLQDAAKQAGCTLPVQTVQAVPVVILVSKEDQKPQ